MQEQDNFSYYVFALNPSIWKRSHYLFLMGYSGTLSRCVELFQRENRDIADARSIAGLRRSDHITDTLASCHWLKAPERVQNTLATIVYRSLNATAPRYLAADLRRLSDVTPRRRLRSSLTDQLDVCQLQRSTVGDRSFAVPGARLFIYLFKNSTQYK